MKDLGINIFDYKKPDPSNDLTSNKKTFKEFTASSQFTTDKLTQETSVVEIKPKELFLSNESTLLSLSRLEENKQDEFYAIHRFNKGLWCKREKDAIIQAVEMFAKEHEISEIKYLVHPKLPNNPYSNQIDNNFFSQIVLKSKINRARFQVSDFLKRHYDSKKCGKWTPEQDAQLIDLVTLKGQKWAEIESLIGHSGGRERYRILSRKMNKTICHGKWTCEESLLLLNAVNKFKKNITKGEISTADKKVQTTWQGIANIVKTRDWRQCLMQWYSHLKITLDVDRKKPKWRRHEQLHILKQMLIFNPVDESDINWPELSESSFNSKWAHGRSADMIRLFWYTIRRQVPDKENLTLIQAIQYCIYNFKKLSKSVPILESEIENSDIEE